LYPKLNRREARDIVQAKWTLDMGLLNDPATIQRDLEEKREGLVELLNRKNKGSDDIQLG